MKNTRSNAFFSEGKLVSAGFYALKLNITESYMFHSVTSVLLWKPCISKGPGKRGHIVTDTLLPTQMFPRWPARATFVAVTNFVSGTQKINVSDFVQKHFVSATNVSQFAQPITGSCYKKMKTPVNECYLKDGFVIIYYNCYGR